MAAEAMQKIREAEEKGAEMINGAYEEAREIIKRAEADSVATGKAMLDEANSLRTEKLAAAVATAEVDGTRLPDEQQVTSARDGEKSSLAADFVVERIVNHRWQ